MNLQDQLQEHLGDAFLLERELGGGGMSRVFVATEIRLNRKVVIKVLSPELAQGLNAERFEREIMLVASLQQANIVPVLSAGDVDGLPYFTMPFVDGESLRARLDGSGLPIPMVTALLRDVSRALEYAHARGVVHRDIKPDNVLLSGSTAVVTDFGIAKALAESQRPEGDGPSDHSTSLTQIGTSIGTPAYMAPEQVAGDPNIDHRVDLYALGCLAYEMLSGRSPFANETSQRMLAAHLSQTATPIRQLRADCPASMATLVTRLLEKDPVDRLQSASAVLARLDEVTTSGSALSLDAPGMLPKALAIYAVALAAVWILAKAAIVGIGLPDWTLKGALLVMLLGLPMLLLTAYVKRIARKSATATPTLTPGGSSVPRPVGGTMATVALKANRHMSWRRTARGGIAAMGLFVLLVAAFMVTRSLGIGPAASLFATGSLAAQDRVLLADFATDSRDSAMAPIVQEAVRAALSQSNAIRVVPPSDVATALIEMKRPNDSPLDASVVGEVAARTNAKAILGGRLVPAGAGYLVSLELRNAGNGVLLASFQGTADGPTDLLGVVDDLTRKLRGKVGESLRSVANTIPLERATTSSLEALRLFSEASRENDITGNYDKSVRLLRQALALDSTFALAWRKLSSAEFNAGAPRSTTDSALVMAARYSDKLPPVERELVIASVHDMHSTMLDLQQSIDAYRAVLRLDSANTVALNNISLNFMAEGQYDSALIYTRKQFQVEPTVMSHLKVAGMLMLEQPQAARAMLDSIATASPSDTAMPQFILFEGALALDRGDLRDAARMVRRLVGSSLPSEHLRGLRFGSVIALTAGQPDAAGTLGERADSVQASRGRSQVLYGLPEVVADVAVGTRLKESVARLDRITASNEWRVMAPADRPYLLVAALYARAGAPAAGQRVLDEMESEWPAALASPDLAPQIALARGEVALATGRYAEALAAFRKGVLDRNGRMALDQPKAFAGIARTFDAMEMPDSAIAYMQRYLAIPGGRRVNARSYYSDAFNLARIHKRLGELYDNAGERDKAIEQYRAFVKQWQDAEPDLQPAVASVRERLQELAGEEGRAGGAP